MLFINTRPLNRAQPLTQALEAKGLTVIELPLLELVAIELSRLELSHQQAFINASLSQRTNKPYQALVVISPTAATMGLIACPDNFKPSCAVIAVGEATARVLMAAGWQVSCPQESSNEGMMQMDVINQLQPDDAVLIWRGRGGRRLLVNHLQDRGIKVDAIEWYERQRPQALTEVFNSMHTRLMNVAQNSSYHLQAKSERPMVLISSGEAFNHWRSLLLETQRYQLGDFNYLAFGARLKATLTNLNLNCIRIDNLNPEAVWRGMGLV